MKNVFALAPATHVAELVQIGRILSMKVVQLELPMKKVSAQTVGENLFQRDSSEVENSMIPMVSRPADGIRLNIWQHHRHSGRGIFHSSGSKLKFIDKCSNRNPLAAAGDER